MARYEKLTAEERSQVWKEIKRIEERGFLSPVEVFDPQGFGFLISYSGDTGPALPIPEFRVYAQQFLNLLAVVLTVHRALFAENALSVKCWIEVTSQSLDLVLWADLPVANAKLGSLEREPEFEIIGMTVGAAMRKLFSNLRSIFWEFGPEKDHFKLWVEYPGSMTACGFVQTLNESHGFLGLKAQLELPYPTADQELRAATLLDFILTDRSGDDTDYAASKLS